MLRCTITNYTYTYRNPNCLHVIGAVGAFNKVRQIELHLIPALVQAHRHRADKRLDTGLHLEVAGAETPSDALVIHDLHTVHTYTIDGMNPSERATAGIRKYGI